MSTKITGKKTDIQEKAKALVERNVLFRANALISTLRELSEATESKGKEWKSEVHKLCYSPHYKLGAEEEKWKLYEFSGKFALMNYMTTRVFNRRSNEVCDWEEDERGYSVDNSDYYFESEDEADNPENWKRICLCEDITPYYIEVSDHWVVTKWLAEKLEAEGEIVSHDCLGLPVWGRCVLGSDISEDWVIQVIAHKYWEAE